MNPPLNIRPADQGDIDVIADFNRAMALETENKTLDREILRAGVAALLNDPALGFYSIAERQGAPVACVLITTEWSDWRNGLFWWLQSVYVVPEERRRGIFRALHEYLLERARAEPRVCGLRLYVERENANARATYTAMGMQETPYRLYETLFEPR